MKVIERAMFRIRDFSRFTRVSVKMLRHYDEIGLFKPAHVDPVTGYRYYSADQLPRLNRIIALKDLGFALDRIAVLLDDDLSPSEIRGMLKLRRTEIAQQLQIEQARLAQVESRLRYIEQAQQYPAHEVVLREIGPQLMATIRQTVPHLGQPIAELFDQVEAHVAAYQARAVSSPLTIFHDLDYREEDLDIEVAVPLIQPIPDAEQIRVREVPGAATMACVVYTGSYDRMEEVLNTLLIWIAAGSYTVAGPIREVYLRFGAGDAEKLNLPSAFLTDQQPLFVTEVQLPVEPQS